MACVDLKRAWISVAVVLAAAAPVFAGETPSGTASADAFAQKVVELTNAERAKFGLPPLKRQPQLDASSTWLAEDMAENNYFEHTDRMGRTIGKRITFFGYDAWSMVGENIAAGCRTPEDVVEAWMQSPGHRENILRPEFSEIGIGFVRSEKNPYKFFWVQDFGKR